MQNEELRRTQAELAAANKRYSRFYDLAPVGFCSLNESGLILESNLTFAAWTGKARGDLPSQSFNRFILPEDQDIYSLHHRQLFETGNPQTCELRLLRQDKEALWVTIEATVVHEPESAPVCLMVLCDITERKQAEKTLAEKEEMYRLIFNSVPVAIYHYDNKGTIKAYNPKASSLLGASEEHIGLNIFKSMTDERVLNCVKTALSGTPSGFEGEYTSAAGKKVHIESYNEPVYSEDGTVSGAVVMVVDAGGRVHAEQALRESKKNLASMFDSIKESVFLIDTTGVLLAMNQTTAQRLRSTVDNMLGKSAYDFLPEDVATYRRGKMEEVIRTRKVVNFEDVRFGRHCKNAFYPVFDDEGNVNRLAIFTQDVHDLKMAEKALRESEEKARALVDATDDAVVLFDRDGVLLDMNDAYAGLVKMEKEAIIGKCIWDYFSQEVAKCRKEFLEQVFLTGQPAVLSDKRNNRVYDSRAYPILSAAGVTTRAALFIRDVTEKKRAEDELKASHARLRELSKYLQTAREDERIRIARGIHDELGQVLTAIILETSWLAKKLTKRQTALKESAEATVRLAKGAIHSVKRIIAELRPSLLSDLGLAEAIKWQAGEYQKRTEIKCSFYIDLDDSNLNDEISTAVFRIFQESFTNVMRHANATEMQVSLQKIGGDIELIVEDNGTGMEGLPDSGKDDFGIIGMKERAQGLGGQFEISGIPGKGTVVVARIPAGNNFPA